jgi:ComF family protein
LYQPPVTRLIRQLKFSHQLLYARILGELLAEKIRSEWYQKKSLPTVIIPIPLHPKRLQTRGFNQALEIARPIAKQLRIPIQTRGISRIKPTLAQATLSQDQRRNNISQAFALSHSVKHQNVAVVDDVVTTGSTLQEFCRLLKKNGAARIDVWCCARAAPK